MLFLHFLHQYGVSFLYPSLIFAVSKPDIRSIKAGYSEYQGRVLFFDTLVKISIMPSLVQEMQEMQVFDAHQQRLLSTEPGTTINRFRNRQNELNDL